MIDRSLFTDGIDSPVPVPMSSTATVPTERIANLLADLCELTEDSRVLELGTGSGYQAAVLAERCREVVSVEIDQFARAGFNPDKLPENVELIRGDGCAYDEGDLFDAVVVTFAAPWLRDSWIKQLKIGGRLVVPQGKDHCRIAVFVKRDDGLEGPKVVGYGKFTPELRG